MNLEEAPKILTYALENFESMDFEAQLAVMAISAQAAEQLKPIVTSHALNSDKPSTFLFKM